MIEFCFTCINPLDEVAVNNDNHPPCFSCDCDPFFCPGGNPDNNTPPDTPPEDPIPPDNDDIRGGSTQNTIGTPYVPAPTDKLVKQNIDLNVEKQDFQTCAIESLFNALVKILGENVTKEEIMIKAIMLSKDFDVIRNGLNNADAIKLINEYTLTKDITFSGTSAFKDAIDAGHCIIGVIPDGGIEHQVTIIGYQQNGDLIYLDSNTADVETTPESSFIRGTAGDLLEIIKAK